MNECGCVPVLAPGLGDSTGQAGLGATGSNREGSVEERKAQDAQLLVPALEHTCK